MPALQTYIFEYCFEGTFEQYESNFKRDINQHKKKIFSKVDYITPYSFKQRLGFLLLMLLTFPNTTDDTLLQIMEKHLSLSMEDVFAAAMKSGVISLFNRFVTDTLLCQLNIEIYFVNPHQFANQLTTPWPKTEENPCDYPSPIFALLTNEQFFIPLFKRNRQDLSQKTKDDLFNRMAKMLCCESKRLIDQLLGKDTFLLQKANDPGNLSDQTTISPTIDSAVEISAQAQQSFPNISYIESQRTPGLSLLLRSHENTHQNLDEPFLDNFIFFIQLFEEPIFKNTLLSHPCFYKKLLINNDITRLPLLTEILLNPKIPPVFLTSLFGNRLFIENLIRIPNLIDILFNHQGELDRTPLLTQLFVNENGHRLLKNLLEYPEIKTRLLTDQRFISLFKVNTLVLPSFSIFNLFSSLTGRKIIDICVKDPCFREKIFNIVDSSQDSLLLYRTSSESPLTYEQVWSEIIMLPSPLFMELLSTRAGLSLIKALFEHQKLYLVQYHMLDTLLENAKIRSLCEDGHIKYVSFERLAISYDKDGSKLKGQIRIHKEVFNPNGRYRCSNNLLFFPSKSIPKPEEHQDQKLILNTWV